jgi:hypothetical protein
VDKGVVSFPPGKGGSWGLFADKPLQCGFGSPVANDRLLHAISAALFAISAVVLILRRDRTVIEQVD